MKQKQLVTIALAIGLVGCSSPKSIYYWGDYQETMYENLKSPTTNIEEQIIEQQKLITLASSKNQQVPPGLYANLGMLYSQQGKLLEAKASFEKEQVLFPESSHYMSFLINNLMGKGSKND